MLSVQLLQRGYHMLTITRYLTADKFPICLSSVSLCGCRVDQS